MEVLIEAESSVKFSPAEREAILEVLEECEDSLVVYHNTLRQQAMMGGEVANFYPEVEYVERVRGNGYIIYLIKKKWHRDGSVFVHLFTAFRKRQFCNRLSETSRRWRIHGRRLYVKSFNETGCSFSLSTLFENIKPTYSVMVDHPINHRRAENFKLNYPSRKFFNMRNNFWRNKFKKINLFFYLYHFRVRLKWT